ncbi:MAG: CHAD domain-containing protein [Chthoniobacteraceae bacterium]
MAYSFHRRESLRAGFRRIADDQLGKVLANLGRISHPGAIHDARKRCKMLRGLLRLVGSGLPKDWHRTEKRRFQRIAQGLGGARDAEVRLATFDQLIAGPAAPLRKVAGPLHDFLEAEATAHRQRVHTARTIKRLKVSAAKSRKLFAAMKLANSGGRIIGAGVERSYGRTRTAFQHALAEPSAKSHHEWRKRTKDLWYHLRLLRGMDRKFLRSRLAQLEAICDLLGDEHDLMVLRAYLAGLPEPLLEPRSAAQLAAVIERRCRDLFAVATKLGTLNLGDEPAKFVATLQQHWKKWRR